MAYIYQTKFDIRSEEANQLRIGKSVAQSLAYLKAFLPNEPGFITSRAMVSLNQKDKAHLVFESYWEDWDSLDQHLQNSPYTEDKIIPKFSLQATLLDLTSTIFEEIG